MRVLLFLLLCVAVWAQPATKTFTDPDLGFSLEYPAALEQAPVKQPAQRLMLLHPDGYTLLVLQLPYPAEVTPRQYAEYVWKESGKRFEAKPLAAPQAMGPLEVHAGDWQMGEGAKMVQGRNYIAVLPGSDKALNFTLGAPAGKLQEALAIFEPVISSVKLGVASTPTPAP